MFDGYTALENVDLNQWDTFSVGDLSRMFCDCTSLQTVAIGQWDTGSAADMNNMFTRCSNLRAPNLKNWDVRGVQDTSGMFSESGYYNTLDLSGWDTRSLTEAHMMFAFSQIYSVDLTGWDTKNVTSMQNLFRECRYLRTIYFTGKLDTRAYTAAPYYNSEFEHFFENCYSMQGGNGTKFTESKLGYARSDLPAQSGYFTDKSLPAIIYHPNDTWPIPYEQRACPAGETVTLFENTYTHNGEKFQGWNTAADGSGEMYQPGDSFVVPEEGITLYAQWG